MFDFSMKVLLEYTVTVFQHFQSGEVNQRVEEEE